MDKLKPRILYITFIDLDEAAASGSSVRPQQMRQAFLDLGCSLVVLQGLHNRVAERAKAVRSLIKQVRSGEVAVDFCYVEPPSGPFFCPEDLRLLSLLKQKGVPIGLFYRDAYWLEKDYSASHGLFKRLLIRAMHKRDLRVFENTCKTIYVPSASFANYVGIQTKALPLPPACQIVPSTGSRRKVDIPTAIFVGAAVRENGVFLILDAFKQINCKSLATKLKIICPRQNWQDLPDDYKSLQEEAWLEVLHLKGQLELAPHYEASDFALLPYVQNRYNDMAVPVKLFEYIAYEKPIVSTNCTEKALFVRDWKIGLVCEDDARSFSHAVQLMASDRNLYETCKDNIAAAHRANLWTARAQAVIDDLYTTSSSSSA